MAKEQLHNLKQTDNSFQVRGKVVGVKGQKFYTSGSGKNGGAWNKIQFGVQIAEGKIVYVVLNGYTRPEVFYYAKGENGAKGTTKRVAWKDRHKSPGEKFRLIGVNISVDKTEDGNVNKTFTEYDAVEHLHTSLKDGESVFIKGTIDFNSFTDKSGQLKRIINLVPNQISYTQQPVNFDAEDYKEMAEFENTLVFNSIDQEEDENGKKTGRFILTGYSIGYNTVENISFIIDAEHKKLATNLKNNMKTGYGIKTYGRVNVIVDTTVVEEEDSGWGETSPMQRLNSSVRREYVIYRAEPATIDRETWSEDAIMKAIKKIKAAKEAVANFGDKPTTNANIDVEVDDEWADDWGNDSSGEDAPW